MNQVAIIGNLTRDPELKHTPSGAAVCDMRVAVNDRRKDGDEWVDVPYFFNVTAWQTLGERCAQYLSKGKRVGVTGKLTWREWEASDGSKRQSVDIVAFAVDFLTPKGEEGSSSGGSSSTYADEPRVDGPVDDDIPF